VVGFAARINHQLSIDYFITTLALHTKVLFQNLSSCHKLLPFPPLHTEIFPTHVFCFLDCLLIFVLYLFVFISCCLSVSFLIEFLVSSSPDQKTTTRGSRLFSVLSSLSTELISLSWAKTCFKHFGRKNPF